MNIREILEGVKSGSLGVDEAAGLLAKTSVVDLGHTKLDFDRRARTGFGEVVFAQSKTVGQVVEIFRAFESRRQNVLATRVSGECMEALKAEFADVECCEIARTVVLRCAEMPEKRGLLAVVSAGTGDMPVAEEARVCAEFFGVNAAAFYDCGVAGLHRLLMHIDEIRKADCVVAVAGMEGALASVLAGLVKVPVVAVPTSVGYGANFGGLSALLAMLNSCANGVGVVNIDNGFGAAYNAALIIKGRNG